MKKFKIVSQFLLNMGYTKEDIIKMTKTMPQIFCYSIENINQKIDDLVSLGYTKEEVIKITNSFSSIIGLSIENIKQKINFYDSIYIHQLVIEDSKQLMQSISLSYARYQYYLSKGIKIDMSNYHKLFMNNKHFERHYGITKEELLKKYNY